MNQNCIRRTPTANRPKPLPIRLDPIPYNKKAAYVESVCAILIESRFGPGRATPIVTDLRKSPELEPPIFCDLTNEGPFPCDSIMPSSEADRRCLAAMLLDKLEQNAPAASSICRQNISPSNLGRGSPPVSGTHADPIFENS